MNIMLAALLWDFVEDQNTMMGSPFSVSNGTPFIVDIGVGTGVPADSDTQMFDDGPTSFTVVVAAGMTLASAGINGTLDFSFLYGIGDADFVGPPAVNGTLSLTEVGTFVQTGVLVTNLSLMLNHSLVTLLLVWSSTSLLTVNVQFSFGNY